MISIFILAVSTAEELGRLSITNLSLEVTESLSVYAAIFFLHDWCIAQICLHSIGSLSLTFNPQSGSDAELDNVAAVTSLQGISLQYHV